MTHDEKRAWIMGGVAVAAYAVYLATILGRAVGTPFPQVPYEWTMVWTVVAAIIAGIVGEIVIAAVWSSDAGIRDQRDREIGQFGEHIGQSLVVIGAITALGLTLVEAAYFWIANAIYLGFVLSAVLGSAAKIAAYRRGFQRS